MKQNVLSAHQARVFPQRDFEAKLVVTREMDFEESAAHHRYCMVALHMM
jgi:hypothetical protein